MREHKKKLEQLQKEKMIGVEVSEWQTNTKKTLQMRRCVLKPFNTGIDHRKGFLALQSKTILHMVLD